MTSEPVMPFSAANFALSASRSTGRPSSGQYEWAPGSCIAFSIARSAGGGGVQCTIPCKDSCQDSNFSQESCSMTCARDKMPSLPRIILCRDDKGIKRLYLNTTTSIYLFPASSRYTGHLWLVCDLKSLVVDTAWITLLMSRNGIC
jgi:hypothetical protein